MGYYLVALVLLVIAPLASLDAFDRFDAQATAQAETAELDRKLAQLELDRARLVQTPVTLQVKFMPEALSDFFSRSVEAGEVLGIGVRIENRDAAAPQPQFHELKHGLFVAPVAIQASTDLAAAPALISMLEEELASLPVSVSAVKARLQADSVMVRMDVDVFGVR